MLVTVLLAGFLNPAVDAADDEYRDQHSLQYGVHLPQDRLLARTLSIAKGLLEERRYAESLPLLVKVLHSPVDAYRQISPSEDTSDSDSLPQSLRLEAAELINGLSKEGLRAYLLEVGAESQRAYEQAVLEGDAELALVASRYPRTPAARAAKWVLAQRAMDAGLHNDACSLLETLINDPDLTGRQREQLTAQRLLAGLWHGDRESALRLLEDHPRLRADVNQSLGVPDAGGPVEQWLDAVLARLTGGSTSDSLLTRRDWLLAGGGNDRNPLLKTSPPHLWATWVHHPAARPNWQSLSTLELASLADSSGGAAPLVVGDCVVVRLGDRLIGVDRDSGKLRWESLLRASSAAPPPERYMRRMQYDQNQLARVLQADLRDAVSSRISSDGQRVFAVAELPVKSELGSFVETSRFTRAGVEGPGVNELVAVDVSAEGKLAWRTHARSSYYLSCPLAVGSRLFAALESEQTIYLEELDPETGESLWRQPLATVETAVQEVPMRRFAGAELAYSDGLLLCSTGSGLLVAVSPVDRTLEWVFRFPSEGGEQLGRGRSLAIRQFRSWPFETNNDWLRNHLLVSGGHAYIGSPESKQMHCVRLADGQRLWSTRNASPQLMCAATSGVVVVARSDAMSGLDSSTGKTLWTVSLPGGAQPSGVGACFGQSCLLPLSSGQAMLVDVETGDVLDSLVVGPQGLLGNLAYDGQAVYSQSFTGLARFDKPPSADESAAAVRAQSAAVHGDTGNAIAMLLTTPREARTDAAELTLRELLSSQFSFEQIEATQLHDLESLYQGGPLPEYVRLARLRLAAARHDPATIADEVLAISAECRDGPLLSVSGTHAIRASRLCRSAVSLELNSEQQALLRRRLEQLPGPNRSAFVARVLPPDEKAELSTLDADPPDSRWATRQVLTAREARDGKTRPRTRTRTNGEPREFALPLSTGYGAPLPEGFRLIGVTDGRLVGVNDFGEQVLDIELPKNSPDRLERLSREGAPVAAVIDRVLYASTGEDVVAIPLAGDHRGELWSARQVLLQADLVGRGAKSARLAGALRSAALDEVRLIGVSPQGIVVAADEIAACLSPADGVVAWLYDTLDLGGSPSCDQQFVYSSPNVRPGWRLDLRDGSHDQLDTPAGEVVAVHGALVALIVSEDDRPQLVLHDRLHAQRVLQRELGPGVCSATLDGLLITVDGSGALELIDLSRREVLLTDHLSLATAAHEVTAVRMGERLFVAVNETAVHSQRAAGATPVDKNPVVTGPVMGYDLRARARLWPSPAQVERKALLARQPDGCPVLTLAANIKSRDASGRYDALHLLMLDAATGRTLHSDAGMRNERAQEYRIRVDEGPRPRYTLALDSQYVVLDLSSEPTPPAPPHTASVEEPKPTDLWSVGSALGRLLGEGLGNQATPLEDDNSGEDILLDDDD